MSLRWKINNKVRALKLWIRPRLGRTTPSQRPPIAGKTDRVVGDPQQSSGKVKDAPRD
ncbi:hypothetical protein [Nonomuraea cavernae]|uniref:hypothetical protein n=1 Tax=Nonomuraea cavernae TaxID=2045107 RepID=UPI0033F2A468